VRFLISRFIQSVLSLLGAVTIVFVVLHFSGNPAAIVAGPTATAQEIHQIYVQMGLNRPLVVQYLSYLWKLVHGNFGYSYSQYEPAIQVVLTHLGYSVELALVGFGIASVFGVVCGVLMARFGGWVESALVALVGVGQSVPSFWLGLMLILLFSVTLHWLPSSGAGSTSAVILPGITLASFLLPSIARVTWQTLLDEVPKDYVRTATAKGVPARTIWFKHMLRNAAIPIVAIGSLQMASLLGGAVLVEVVFAWPGIGQLTVQAVEALDLPVVETIVILASAAFIGANFIADVIYVVLDPRLSLDGGVDHG